MRTIIESREALRKLVVRFLLRGWAWRILFGYLGGGCCVCEVTETNGGFEVVCDEAGE